MFRVNLAKDEVHKGLLGQDLFQQEKNLRKSCFLNKLCATFLSLTTPTSHTNNTRKNETQFKSI
eukprot:m.151431 g.151431  ORF g.151431 m.151431 type:complete len:64 (+) comp14292_c0_seq1:520-711(+)